MTRKIKHIALILGLLSLMASFLFFGRQQVIYHLLLFGGLLVSLVFYLTILLTKESSKSKLIWTLVILFSVTVQWLIEPVLVKCSYLIFIKNNQTELAAVNRILINKIGEIDILNDRINDKNGVLTQIEKDNLLNLRQKLDVYVITKSDNEIYYGLWGFLDVRIGIIYWTNDERPDNSYSSLTDNWYIHLTNN